MRSCLCPGAAPTDLGLGVAAAGESGFQVWSEVCVFAWQKVRPVTACSPLPVSMSWPPEQGRGQEDAGYDTEPPLCVQTLTTCGY